MILKTRVILLFDKKINMPNLIEQVIRAIRHVFPKCLEIFRLRLRIYFASYHKNMSRSFARVDEHDQRRYLWAM